MVRPTFTVQLDKRVLERLIRQAPDKADDALEALAREGERYVKMSMASGPAPSAPGEPPHRQSGILMAGISVYRPALLQRILASAAEYGPYLEFGTRKMAARPFMGPAVMYLKDAAPGIFNAFLER